MLRLIAPARKRVGNAAVALTCLAAAAVLAVNMFGATPATAGPGHDHGETAAPAGAAPASPRVVASSENYQLVGIVEGEALVVYLDRQETNEPVTGATIELSLNGTAFAATLQKNGTFEITAPVLKQPGSIEVLATIVEGKTSDLLVGSLTIPRPLPAEPSAAGGLIAKLLGVPTVLLGNVTAGKSAGAPLIATTELLALAAGAALILAFAVVGVRRWRRKSIAALITALLLLPSPPRAAAGEGHDHGPDLSASSANTPQRKADGTIFLPKPAQRLLEVRTRTVKPGEAARTVKLAGRVVANPNFSGIVQSTLQGRYQAPSGGVPAIGTRVRAGDLLGSVAPSFTSVDSSDMAQTLGDLDQKIALAKSKLARQEQLLRTNVVARALVDETRLELDGLQKRRVELLAARVRPEELRAPVDGIIAHSRVVSGQVVAPSDRIFEIVDPTRLLIEALVFDEISADAVTAATAVVRGAASAKLRFLGRSRSLQQQYSLMQFEVVDALDALNVGMPVAVLVESGAPVSGLFVPKAALAQAPNGQMVVFEHKEPEVFVPRAVRSEAFDNQTVRITAGIEPGTKIVVRNAPLVAQVR